MFGAPFAQRLCSAAAPELRLAGALHPSPLAPHPPLRRSREPRVLGPGLQETIAPASRTLCSLLWPYHARRPDALSSEPTLISP